MHGKEESVLVKLGSHHNSVERPVWPVFPDYLFDFCDCARTKVKGGLYKKLVDLEFFADIY